ncbi:Pog1p KNAG_0E01820 [Huiozyma naganishii CBS 8797]|uniref:Uncharacterized protein n=1 Tax=Huiozyma naganishii (strain ATCC MYA-139 / BCRC 22969 / CBS 8797 / KCTC 17520 / NBRC 10181 / NCYC 3082 / Yp74L-3) TaxID=1071383 RepID=J7S6K5_HUIN7|nr:hypothetical protein KNAG_0E01820 [Kazachstania naganishii CBS 8797]CCK70444.1 hypothetical protein KNAG_0E01820 [Kazachstania naganishii CBS 8797]
MERPSSDSALPISSGMHSTPGSNTNLTSRPTTYSEDSPRKSLSTSVLIEKGKRGGSTTLLDRKNFKQLVFEELGLQGDAAACPDEMFNKYVEARLVKENIRKEELRQRNLDRLDSILKKYISSEKLTEPILTHILQLVDDPGSIPDLKKRKIDNVTSVSPRLASPRGTRPYKSDIPPINELGFSKQQPAAAQFQQPGLQTYLLPVPAIGSTWQTSGYAGDTGGGAIATASIPPIAQYQSYSNSTRAQQTGYTQGYVQQPSGGSIPIMVMPPNNTGEPGTIPDPISQSPSYLNLPGISQQQAHHQQPIHASPFRQTQSMDTSNKRGHRRSQSAIVTANADFRSPQRASTINQRPVNFLIHTPKHPPPS